MGFPVKRVIRPREKLASMTAHQGVCKYCKNPVKMPRDPETKKLRPEFCHCIVCGQGYFMEIKDIVEWEKEQWEQKATE